MPEEEIQETQETQEQPQTDPAIMAQAKLFGYKEDYDGHNKLSPEEYVQRAFQRLDIAKGTIGTLTRKNDELVKNSETLQAKLDTLTTGFKQFVENSRKAEERAYERARKELEGQMERAVEDSDTAAYKKAKGELDMLEAQIKEHPALTGKEQPVEAMPTSPAKDGIMPGWSVEKQDEWLDKNRWYVEDSDMGDYADKIDIRLGKTREGRAQTWDERMDAVAEAVKKKFPEYFGEKPAASGGNSNPRRAGAVAEESAEAPSNSGKKTYADLPKEAKVMCDQLVAEGILTKEDYVKTYQWD